MKRIIAGVCLLSTAACATMPDVTARYYLPESSFRLVVTQTVACDANNVPHYSPIEFVDATTHQADYNQPRSIRFRDFGGFGAASTVGVNFHPDGRLSGVNSTSTGRGQAVLSAATTILSGGGGGDDRPQEETPQVQGNPFQADCEALRKDDAKRTLTRVLLLNDSFQDLISGPRPVASETQSDENSTQTTISTEEISTQTRIPSFVDHPHNEVVQTEYGTLFPHLCYSRVPDIPATGRLFPGQDRPDDESTRLSGNGEQHIRIREPRWVRVAVHVLTAEGNECPTPDEAENRLWFAEVPVSQLGTEFDVPIPTAALFGEQTFKLGIDDAGRMTSISYGATGGQEILDVATFAADQAIRTDAERLEALKLQNAISENRSIALCRSDASQCDD